MTDFESFISRKLAEAKAEYAEYAERERYRAERAEAERKALQENISQSTAEQGDPVFYGVKDVARLMGCSIPTARELMHRKDFPSVEVGRKLMVSKSALNRWASVKRI